jgi:hypothetical protein
MSKHTQNSELIFDDEEELRLDQEFQTQLLQEINTEISEELKTRDMVNSYSDIQSYLEKNALNTELFVKVSSDTIDNLIYSLIPN